MQAPCFQSQSQSPIQLPYHSHKVQGGLHEPLGSSLQTTHLNMASMFGKSAFKDSKHHDGAGDTEALPEAYAWMLGDLA